MLKNFLLQSWRSLIKNKTYSILNIAGLSAGLTCFAFIALWVMDELSYDRFNTKYDQIVRLTATAKTEAGTTHSARTSAPMAKALKDDYPEIENTLRLGMREEIVRHNNQQFLQGAILIADQSFFDVFSYGLSKGNIKTALSDPWSIVLTESAASKYFGKTNPIGQTLTLNLMDSTDMGATYNITGVMPDPPNNSHFKFEMIASFKTMEIARPVFLSASGWSMPGFYTYLLLKKGVDQKAFSKKISHFYEKHIGERASSWRSIYSYQLQPLRDIYLRSGYPGDIGPMGSITQIYLFSTIGIFILLLAGINYVNLSTARSVTRAKEVGIKKVIGALKQQLIFQYLAEAVLTALIALAIAVMLAFIFQPLFFEASGKDLDLFSSPVLLIFLLGGTVFLGILAGIYPAMVFSNFKPVQVLKGSFKTGTKGVFLRKSLVIAQFIITIILISGIVVIHAQMSYLSNKDLGFDKDGILFLRVHGNTEVVTKYAAFKNDLLTSRLISGVSRSNSQPLGGLSLSEFETVNGREEPIKINMAMLRADPEYTYVFGLRLIAGKNFQPNASTDSLLTLIINEEAVKKIGWKDAANAIGKPLKINGNNGIVIGVVRNYHFNSLQQLIEPMVINPRQFSFSRIGVKIDLAKSQEAINWIQSNWIKHFPRTLLDYEFVDSQRADHFRSEARFSNIFLSFSVLSLIIACLGLYGLIAYATTQKTKEIGIRKVLGASAHGIAVRLCFDFLKLVCLASFVAIPISIYLMSDWLQEFAYRTDLSWWMFALAVFMVLIVALVTVSFQAIKAGMANPVKSLKME